MINIVSLILTRRCNLKCEYCRISGDTDYIISPREYPSSEYYFDNEQSSEFWVDVIKRLIMYNKDIFFILFGGEPFLYDGLERIIKFLSWRTTKYTIISNCTAIEKMKKFFNNVARVKGFTASVDPGFWLKESDHEHLKSLMGFEMLKYLVEKDLTDDPVAEITVDNDNIIYLEETVKRLTDEGITSDITVLDIAKNNYYDFSSITSTDQLVAKSQYTKEVFNNLVNGNYKIHMKKILLPEIYTILPANLDCKLERGLDNITIDSDGSLRTCLRIRGREVPKLKILNQIDYNGFWNDMDEMLEKYKQDKQTLCMGCSWTCPIMSKLGIKGIHDH